MDKSTIFLSQRWESDPRPRHYQWRALPLSHSGNIYINITFIYYLLNPAINTSWTLFRGKLLISIVFDKSNTNFEVYPLKLNTLSFSPLSHSGNIYTNITFWHYLLNPAINTSWTLFRGKLFISIVFDKSNTYFEVSPLKLNTLSFSPLSYTPVN